MTAVKPNKARTRRLSTGGQSPAAKEKLEATAPIVKAREANDQKSGLPVLHMAAARGDTDMLWLGINSGLNPSGTEPTAACTPLHWAAGAGEMAAVEVLLLHAGADPHARNKDGSTPLHYAALGASPEAALFLLKEGPVDPNVTNYLGKTPLHIASSLGHTDVLNVLLRAGADVNARDAKGNTPLHGAGLLKWDTSSYTALLAAGADPSISNNLGETAKDPRTGKKKALIAITAGGTVALITTAVVVIQVLSSQRKSRRRSPNWG